MFMAVRTVAEMLSPEKAAVPDALDVSLHDLELAAEVELTVNLMIAINESPQPLSSADVDRILGVSAAPVLAGHSVPAQRRAV